VYAALAGNLLIAVAKFVAAAFTGSSAMLSKGMDSVVDTGNQALLLYGMRRAQRPPCVASSAKKIPPISPCCSKTALHSPGSWWRSSVCIGGARGR